MKSSGSKRLCVGQNLDSRTHDCGIGDQASDLTIAVNNIYTSEISK
jgi:hypothetical protein